MDIKQSFIIIVSVFRFFISAKISKYRKQMHFNDSDIYQVNYGEEGKNTEYQLNKAISSLEEQEEEEIAISQIELWLFEKINKLCCRCSPNWGLIYGISLNISLFFILISCFLRSDFFNVRKNYI